jgi:hypothetical protein
MFGGGVFCCRALALDGCAPGLATGADHALFGLAVLFGGGALGRLFAAGGGTAFGRCATFGGGVFCGRALVLGDGAPGLATGADHALFGFAVLFGGGALGRLFAAGSGTAFGCCATFGGGVFCCRALALDGGASGLATGADQGLLA